MRSHLRPFSGRLLVAALALVMLAGLAATVRPTSAQWADQALGVAPASSGNWGSSSLGTCTLLKADGSDDMSRICTVAAIALQDDGSYKPQGSRTLSFQLTLDYGGDSGRTGSRSA